MTTAASPGVIDPLKQFMAGAFAAATRHPLPLIATAFDVEIAGGIAVVTVTRRFRNDEAAGIEATITFPMPVHAVLFDLAARIGGRLLKARAQSRNHARETYESAVERGKAAVLHEEVLRGVHMLSVAHIAPGETIEVTARWTATLSLIGDEQRLRIPLTVGDIYGHSPLIEADRLIHGGPAQRATLTLRCAEGAVMLHGQPLVSGAAEVGLDAPIDLAVRGVSPRDLRGRAADGRSVTLRVEPQAPADGWLDLAILADHSGSMDATCGGTAGGPTKHQAMMLGLLALAERIGPADRIDLWQFAHQPRQLGSTVETIDGERARRRPLADLIARMSMPAGGTEIGAALSTVIAQSHARDILLITDGKSDALDVQTLAGMGRRVTVVLIGEDSLEANVGHLAALTGGDVLVAASDRIAESLLTAADGLRASAPGAEREGRYPTRLAVTRGGARITVRWQAPAAAEQSTDESIIARAVAALAAGLALPSLSSADAARLAEAEGLVTHLTSLVLVDEEAVAQPGLPVTRKIALPTPRATERPLAALRMSTDLGPIPTAPMSDAARPGAAAPRPATPAAPPPASSGERIGDTRFMRHSGETPKAKPSAPPGALFSRGATKPVAPGLILDLSRLPAAIDWNGQGDRLANGDLSGLESAVRALIERAATLDTVKRTAGRCGISPLQLVLALVAGAAGDDRHAARVRRAILNGRSSRAMDEAGKALNLFGRGGFLKRLLAR